MKCTGDTGVGIESFKDISVGVDSSEDVLEAKMVLAGAILTYSENIFFLRSMFSATASTTRSAVFRASSGFVAIFSLGK